MWVQVQDIPKLGVVLPMSRGEPPVIAFPLTLPMGWVESPPYFTVLTETACDLANSALHSTSHSFQRAHRLEAVAATSPPTDKSTAAATERPCSTERLRWDKRPRSTARPPVAAVDVYVDDFLLMAQTDAQRCKVMRTTLNSIDAVFRPLSDTDPSHRKEPASVKKMLQGDACWATNKRILGWDFDTVSQTIHLPPHHLKRLYELLDSISPPL